MTSIELYTLQIVSDGTQNEKLDLDKVNAALAEAEQNITDLLQPGYRAIIRHWNEGTKPE